MNYLLTILNTPIQENEFLAQFVRYMSPISEGDGSYIQYESGVMLYHFETKLDKTGLNDHLKGLNENFELIYVLSQMSENMTFCLGEESLNQIFIFGPEIPDESCPFQIVYDYDERSEEYDDEHLMDFDQVARKLMKKFTFQEQEPTMDEILEKIHEQGVDSLSIQELAILKSI